MRLILRKLRRRLALESGYSVVAVMLLMMAGSMFAVASWTAANSDIPETQKDFNRKQAFDAAEAGLQWYLYHLNQDNSYWTYCDTPPDATPGMPLMQPWNGTSTRPFKTLPNSTASFVTELVPQNGNTTCNTAAPDTSMIDQASGTLQIRSTGRSQGVRRELTGTFRRKGFLDFLYFTKFETQDPVVFTKRNPSYIGLTSPGACDVYRWASPSRPSGCAEIQFANNDAVNGPFHTNDNVLVCGSPTFGRNSGDKVETGGTGSTPAFVSNGGCANTPNVRGTLNSKADLLEVPASNAQLATIAGPQYTFKGRTYIKLNGNSITTSSDFAATQNVKTLPWPTNGVIFVKSDPTNPGGMGDCTYDIQQSYDNKPGCADAYVSGSYSQGLTIGSDNDIIVNGNTIRQGNGMLGLIATNFVRVWHPVNRSSCGTNVGSSSMGPAPFASGIRIDAALLSLNHSFMVDNYDCGPNEGTLTVNGAIAQKYRGPVATGSGGGISTGYLKNYNYDDRFKTQNPPYFLNPVDSKWQLVRFNERIPAR
jgi:hypothetical protein